MSSEHPSRFERFGRCPECNVRQATGRLRSNRNGDYGLRCEPCARKAIAKAAREDAGGKRSS